MNPEELNIPLHCIDCPYISPIADRLTALDGESSLYGGSHSHMIDLVNTDVADARLDEINDAIVDEFDKLALQRVWTIGCAGVRLVGGRIECGSRPTTTEE